MTLFIASGSENRIAGAGLSAPCVFGKAGLVAAEAKQEGDKASPIGIWPVRRAFYRADRIAAPRTGLRLDAITPADGWCDAPDDPAYNRLVRLPYPASHETLIRDDGLYDLIVVLGHNDNPPLPREGSAIFLHCMAESGSGTLGCVAAPRAALIEIVEAMKPGDAVEIRA